MDNPFSQLKQLVLSLEPDFEKWEQVRDLSAGTRLRSAAQQLKGQAQSIRHDIQSFKNGKLDSQAPSAVPAAAPVGKVEAAPKSAAHQFEQDAFAHILGPISYSGRSIHTRFTDQQAVNICGKMADAYARNIAIKYQELAIHVQGGIYRYQLHYFANKAFSFYGGPFLTFLANLRPLQFHNTSALALKRFVATSGFSDRIIDFPTLTFHTVGGDAFTMAFHLVEDGVEARRKPVQIFRNQVRVGSIDYQGMAFDAMGKILARTAAVRPVLLVFCDYLKCSVNPAFFSGVETGHCFICGRPLTDPRSLRYGIGPTCLSRAI
ncbi:hypothetical protein GCM10022408_37700 [Hymenobacter fastidiosus]|uniref:Uncharacterized protein n=1 Tax=Hymenobacter fastidiosus TaxID=486264 RepID=A0ABP7T4X6_9BACT